MTKNTTVLKRKGKKTIVYQVTILCSAHIHYTLQRHTHNYVVNLVYYYIVYTPTTTHYHYYTKKNATEGVWGFRRLVLCVR